MNFIHKERTSRQENTNNSRTIVAKLLDHREKENIMQQCYKLKDTTYFVGKDLSNETVQICKQQIMGSS